MTTVVEQDGERGGLQFVVGDDVALGTQQLYGTAHQVHGTEAVGETGVVGAWIHHVGHAHLLDAAQTLEIGVLDDVEMQLVGYAHKTVNRVVEDFLLVDLVGHIPDFSPQIYQKVFNHQPKKEGSGASS